MNRQKIPTILLMAAFFLSFLFIEGYAQDEEGDVFVVFIKPPYTHERAQRFFEHFKGELSTWWKEEGKKIVKGTWGIFLYPYNLKERKRGVGLDLEIFIVADGDDALSVTVGIIPYSMLMLIKPARIPVLAQRAAKTTILVLLKESEKLRDKKAV